MPATPLLAHAWYDTPNIHLCTIKDFLALCAETGIVIERALTLDRSGLPLSLSHLAANLMAEQALFVLSRGRP
jgi:methionine biosynthesis protein MetW